MQDPWEAQILDLVHHVVRLGDSLFDEVVIAHARECSRDPYQSLFHEKVIGVPI